MMKIDIGLSKCLFNTVLAIPIIYSDVSSENKHYLSIILSSSTLGSTFALIHIQILSNHYLTCDFSLLPSQLSKVSINLEAFHYKLACCITVMTASAVFFISKLVSVGCTTNIKLVSPSSMAIGRPCLGLKFVPSKAFSL